MMLKQLCGLGAIFGVLFGTLSAPCSAQVAGVAPAEGPRILQGLVICERFDVRAGEEVWLQGDVEIRARGEVHIDGILRCMQRPSGGDSRDAPDLLIESSRGIWIRGVLQGAKGTPGLLGEPCLKNCMEAGGAGSDLELRAPVLFIEGLVVAGAGGGSGPNADGARGGHVRTFGVCSSPRFSSQLDGSGRMRLTGLYGGDGGRHLGGQSLTHARPPGVGGMGGSVFQFSSVVTRGQGAGVQGRWSNRLGAGQGASGGLGGPGPQGNADRRVGRLVGLNGITGTHGTGGDGVEGAVGANGTFDSPNGQDGARGGPGGKGVATSGQIGGVGPDFCPRGPGGVGGVGGLGGSGTGGAGAAGGPGGDAYYDVPMGNYTGLGGRGGDGGDGGNGISGHGGGGGQGGPPFGPLGSGGKGGQGVGGAPGVGGLGGHGFGGRGPSGRLGHVGLFVSGLKGNPGSLGGPCHN